MSGILKRTIYVEADKSHTISGQTPVFRWADWAKVVTGIGSMCEPHCGIQRYSVGRSATAAPEGLTNHDFEDQIAMVNGIKFIENGEMDEILSSGSVTDASGATMGGPHLPRKGR